MRRISIMTLAALVAANALGPMATQMVTPAIPFVHRDLHVPMAVAQTLVSLAFAAIALMTLAFGPLSDRFGRRPVILAGTGLFCAGSLIGALAPTPEVLILGRIVQASGSAAGLVLARAIVHDMYGSERSARVLAYLTVAMIFVPMLSPVVGGLLIEYLDWRAVFEFCAVAGLAALSLLVLWLPETAGERGEDEQPHRSWEGVVALLRDWRYLALIFFFSLIMATFFTFQAALPYLIVEVRGGSATEYGAWFALACVFYVAGVYASARRGDVIGRFNLMLISGLGCLASAIAGLAFVGSNWTVPIVIAPMLVLCFFGGLAVAPVQAAAVSLRPRHSGAASGLMSGMQMAIGAAVVQIVGFSHDGTPHPMFMVLVGCSALALLAAMVANAAPLRAGIVRLARLAGANRARRSRAYRRGIRTAQRAMGTLRRHPRKPGRSRPRAESSCDVA
jgi:DHA1 family bicyclomycin/chloramphenicol resistance-like MFS transporter